MVIVTKLNGARVAVNSDLIQRVEATPDTVITLVDGTKMLVVQSVDTVIDLVRDFRASVLVVAEQMRDHPAQAELRLLSADERKDR